MIDEDRLLSSKPNRLNNFLNCYPRSASAPMPLKRLCVGKGRPAVRYTHYLLMAATCVIIAITTILPPSKAFAPVAQPFSRSCTGRILWLYESADEGSVDKREVVEARKGQSVKLGDMFSKTASQVQKLAQQGSDNVKSAASATEGGIKSVASATGESVRAVGTGIKSVANATSEGVKSVGSGVASATGVGVRAVETGVKSVVSTTGEGVKSVGAGVKSVVSAAGEGVRGVGSGVKSVASATREGVKSVGAGVKSVASGTGEGVMTVAGAATSRISQITGSAAVDVKRATTAASSNISEFARRGTADVKTVAVDASSTLAGFFKKRAEDATSVVHWLDTQAKGGATAVNTRAQNLVLSFTGKQEYQFGDIAKEVVRRASTADYNIKDIMLLVRLLLTVGASFTPLAKLLPLSVLLEMLNESIEARIGGKVIEVLAGSLDERFVAALDAEELGDFAKRSLSAALVVFTGRESYKSGDIERAVAKEESSTGTPKTLDVPIGPAFEDWDRAFRESHPGVELAIEESLNSSQNATAKTLDMEIVRSQEMQ